MAADAVKRLAGVTDIQTVGAILHEKQAAEVVAENLAALIDNAAAREEAERIADARGRRIAAIEKAAGERNANAQVLVSGKLGKRLADAVAELSAVKAAADAAGFPLDLTIAVPRFVERMQSEMVSAGKRIAAETKALSPEFVDEDKAVEALGQARQAYSWATGATDLPPPHVLRQAIRKSVEPGSMTESQFVSEVWIADQDSRDRVLWLISQGSTL
ncbi:hypothetical protein [Devosia sp.]|uniref:hypothetical protein n=1 Tax=Devosia sp. TaxID=1871048 RepID=UPI0037C043DB